MPKVRWRSILYSARSALTGAEKRRRFPAGAQRAAMFNCGYNSDLMSPLAAEAALAR